MDTSNEFQDAPPTPETMAQKIAAISSMIEGQADEPANQTSDNTGGDDVSEPPVRGDDGGSGAVDSEVGDAVPGVEDDTEVEAAPDPETDSGPVSLSTLADHLGVEPADVYELEVPIGDGVTTTLGQLKDEFKEYGPAKEYQAELQRERGDFERQVLATRSELSAIVNAIPPEIRDHVIAQGRAHQQQWEQNQERAVLEAIPDWADADSRAKDRALLIEDGAEYGFSEQEITYTQDARTLRFMRDFSRMKRELQEMRAAAKATPGRASAPARPASNTQSTRKLAQALSRAKSDPTIQGKASVVSQLIRNQR